MARSKRKSDAQLIKDVDVYLEHCYDILKRVAAASTLNGAVDSVPTVIGFAHRNGYTRQALYKRADECPELKEALTKLVETKEQLLEVYSLWGIFNPSVAIFSLKQLGWTDKTEVDVDNDIKVSFDDPSGDEIDAYGA